MLITANEVIQTAFASKNMDVSLIEMNIPVAELEYIEKVLGEDLYNQISDEYDTQNFTGFNKEMLTGYIQPALTWYTACESLPGISAEPTSNGLNKNTPIDTIPGTEGDYTRLRGMYIRRAEAQIKRLKKFACKNNIKLCGENVSGKGLPLIY